MKKDVIYIDVEDDITSIISRLKKSSSKIIALVPPKRASVLSSVVNLKLLKKAATDKNKKLVLVTADPGLKSLAGGLDMYVAKNLTSPPEIPEKTTKPNIPSDTITAESRAATKTTKDVGKAAAAGAVVASADIASDEKAAKKKLPPLSKGKLPNFNSFRKKLFIGAALLVVLGIGWWYAFFVMPTATITLKGQTINIRSEFDLELDTNATSPNLDENILPAQVISVKTTNTAEVAATGERDKGKKATGTLTIENCYSSDPVTFLANSQIQASSGERFVTNAQVTVPGGTFAGGCTSAGTASVGVTAAEAGDQYNLAETSYEFVNEVGGDYDLTGSAMSGGTSNIVKYITKDDVDAAVDSLDTDQTSQDALEAIRSEAGGDVYVFDDTLSTDIGDPELDDAVGTETDKSQVTVVVTHTAFAVENAQLDEVLTKQYESQIAEQQTVVDTGSAEIVTRVKTSDEDSAIIAVVANGQAGPDVNPEQLAEELVGVRLSLAQSTTEDLPGVVESTVELQPFWVSKMPRSPDKITVEISDIQE